jgi:hypothetical protein
MTDRCGSPLNPESDFGIDWADQLIVSAYSSGAIGGLEIADFGSLIRYLRKQAANE